MSSNVDEIYQEGLRLPVVRLMRAGEIVGDVMNIVLLNVRNPVERRGDYNAQIAACRLAARRYKSLVERYGTSTLDAAADAVIARTERRMRQAIATVPDGTYRFADFTRRRRHQNAPRFRCSSVSTSKATASSSISQERARRSKAI